MVVDDLRSSLTYDVEQGIALISANFNQKG